MTLFSSFSFFGLGRLPQHIQDSLGYFPKKPFWVSRSAQPNDLIPKAGGNYMLEPLVECWAMLCHYYLLVSKHRRGTGNKRLEIYQLWLCQKTGCRITSDTERPVSRKEGTGLSAFPIPEGTWQYLDWNYIRGSLRKRTLRYFMKLRRWISWQKKERAENKRFMTICDCALWVIIFVLSIWNQS